MYIFINDQPQTGGDMKNDLIKMQKEEIDSKNQILKKARLDYFNAVEKYDPFTSPPLDPHNADKHQLLHSAQNLVRAPYSDRVAWVMAIMANLAYIEFEANDDEYHNLELNLESGGFTLVKTFSKGSTQAFLAKNHVYAVLAFRGTEPKKWEDVRADLRAYKSTVKEGKVHAGFLDAYKEVDKEIERSLIDENQDRWPLYITGHSLGGALATVATRELDAVKGIGDQIAACYTFGSPRVGNKKYENTIKVPFYRIVHSTDIVTLAPSFGYAHVGDARFISRSGQLYRSIPLFRRGFEMLIAILPFYWGRWVTCHDINIYQEKLKKIAVHRN